MNPVGDAGDDRFRYGEHIEGDEELKIEMNHLCRRNSKG